MNLDAFYDDLAAEVELAHSLPYGLLHRRELPDGRLIGLMPLLLGAAALCIGRTSELAAQWGGWDDQWEYQDRDRAIHAFADWNPAIDPEPLGWTRHPGSGRRRPDGDPAREFVRP